MSTPRRPAPLPDELVDAFSRWRCTRPNGSGPTPEPLRRRAVALLERHRISTIARALEINPTAIERW